MSINNEPVRYAGASLMVGFSLLAERVSTE